MVHAATIHTVCVLSATLKNTTDRFRSYLNVTGFKVYERRLHRFCHYNGFKNVKNS